MEGFRMTRFASGIVSVVLLSAQAEVLAASIVEAGEFDGLVNADIVERGGETVIDFETPFATTEPPVLVAIVVQRWAGNGLVEGTAIRGVAEIHGSAGNWTGFTITVSKYSTGTSIDDMTGVHVTWIAVSRMDGGAVPAVGVWGLVVMVLLGLVAGTMMIRKRQVA